MHSLRDLPIRRKLVLVTMLASGIAILAACLAFVAYERVVFRERIVRDLSITAAMTAANSAAGLAFNEPGSVEVALKSLSVQPSILRGCIYNKEGQAFARYQRGDLKGQFTPPPVQGDGYHFSGDELELFRRFDLAGEPIGTAYLAMDLREMTTRLWRYTLIVGIVLFGAMLVALLVSVRMQKVITEPLTNLARTVTRVATEKDYSVRASREGRDEVGRLIEGFNEMLSQIQERDAALEGARANLERRVEERTSELANSLSLLNATLESTTDGILALDLADRVVCYNRNLLTLWGIPDDILQRGCHSEIIAFVASKTSSPEQFIESTRAHRANPGLEFSDVVILKDGRVFERHVRPQKIDSQCVGQVITLRDVTERRRFEAKIEEVSRSAGMAEVATSVLHNVGNVLNSVNTSAAVIRNHLVGSPEGDLARVVGLMEEHERDLAEFLGQGNRGAQLVTYLRCLNTHLTTAQSAVLTELRELTRNIDHIKEIVAMQQDYARTAGVVEIQSLPMLVEDALRMYDGALGRHQVRIVRRFNEVPDIPLDKHKVLQILVNLVSNAKHALAGSESADRVLTLDISRNGEDGVQVSVSDNGVGIASENLTRIFSHGFTTRKGGHGFGLHSAALAAREMGGALLAQSDGPGRGTTFRLQLPISPPNSAL